MNQPGTLRHSKAHREAVKRAESRHTYRWLIRVPQRLIRRSGDSALELAGLPANTRIIRTEHFVFEDAFAVLVEVPGGKTLTVRPGITAQRMGRC